MAMNGGERWLSAAGLLLLLGAGAASAADLAVRVQDDQGRRLQGAAVCAGTPAQPAQFGAVYSRADGSARFERIPSTELAVTVSMPGYRGESLRLGAVRFDRLVIVTLSPGGLGPSCQPPGPQPGIGQGSALRIADLRVVDLSGTDYPPRVTLAFRVIGDADEYRISERPDFSDAAWQALVDRPVHRLGGGGRRTLYLQVRRHQELGAGELSIESDVARLTIEVGPGR